jgi:hypothetical protein
MGKKKKAKEYGITLAMAQKHLEEWMEAELEITTHQSYRLGNQTLTMADLEQVRGTIDYWSEKVERLKAIAAAGGRNRAYRIVPRDW